MNYLVSVTTFVLIFVSFLIPCHVSADATEDFDLTYVGSCLHAQLGATAIDGDYAYSVTSNGLLVIDISDALNPVLVSEIYLSDRTFFHPQSESRPCIAIRNNHAYILGTSTLTIMNIANPYAPYMVGKYHYSDDTEDYTTDLVISGNRAYILGRLGMSIIDISDPGNPSSLGRYDLYRCAGLSIADTLAYVVTYNNGLFVLNVADPTAPTEIAHCDRSGSDIEANDTLAYVLTGGGGLFIMNIADPLSPFEIANYETGGGGALSLTISDDLACICNFHSAFFVDISDPTSLTLQSFTNDFTGTMQIEVHDTLAYLSNYYNGLTILNMSDASEPSNLGEYQARGMGDKMAIAGNYAYGISGFYLKAVNFSRPNNPYLQGVCTLTAFTNYGDLDIDYPVNLAIDDTLLYVACLAGLSVVNIASPGSPVLTDIWLDLDSCWESTAIIRGDYLYLAGYDLYTINISNSPAIFVEGMAGAFNIAGNIAFHGDYAYALSTVIFDISDPAFPYEIASNQEIYWESINGLDIRWPYLYGTGYSDNGGPILFIANVEDPYNPYLITRIYTDDNGAEDLHLVGDSAYVLGMDSLLIYNISDPEVLELAGGANFGGNAFEVIDDYFYFTSRSGFVIATTSPETCGDINDDNMVNAGDVVLLINHIFKGGPPPDPPESADFDGSGQVNVGDPVYLLNYLFTGGPAPYCP